LNLTLKKYLGRVEEVIKKAEAGEVYPVYLFIGDRPIMHPQINKLIDCLVSDEVKDFNFEILSADFFSEGRLLELLETRGFFPGRKVILIQDLPLLVSTDTAKARWKRALAAIEAAEVDQAKEFISRIFSDMKIDPKELMGLSSGQMKEILNWPKDLRIENLSEFLKDYGEDLECTESIHTGSGDRFLSWLDQRADPSRAVVIIESEVVDRRCSFYKELKKHGPVVDLDKEKKDTKNGADFARGFIRSLIREKGKEIEPKAIEIIIERVGHEDLVGMKTEIQKLISQAGDSVRIKAVDVCELVVRHKDEELYKLTGAIGEKDLDKCLNSLNYLVDQGIHPLAILQTIANFLRKMIILRTVFEYVPGIQEIKKLEFNTFRDKILPEIKEVQGDALSAMLKGAHPYALYKLSLQAHGFDLDRMLDFLASMAEMDLEFKGGQVSDRILLEVLIFRFISME
jgi:DNA polymerase III subunit delta